MDEDKTKGERRDDKRRKRRKMSVVGRTVRTLQRIITRRAKKAEGEESG